MRVTIKAHNRQFMNRLASQMECYDQTEVINYLLTELKRINYSFNSSVNLGINFPSMPSSLPSEVPQIEEPGQHAQSGLSYCAEMATAIDPDIERLLSLGLDQF